MAVNPLPSVNIKMTPILLVSLLGFIFGTRLLLYQTKDASQLSQAFISTDEFLIWMFLVAAGCVLMFAAPFILAMDIRPLWKFARGETLDLLLSMFLVALLFAIPTLFSPTTATSGIEFPLQYHRQKMMVLYLLMFFMLLLPCALGFWLLRRALAVEFRSIDPSSAVIEAYMRYRERLQRFLLILGLGVTILTLATGALRKAVIAVGIASPDTFPVNFVLIYGGYFTLLLAILYLPAYSALLEAGRRVRDAYCPFPEADSPDWDKTLAKRKTLEETLLLTHSFQQNLSAGVTILAPLLSGALSVLRD